MGAKPVPCYNRIRAINDRVIMRLQCIYIHIYAYANMHIHMHMQICIYICINMCEYMCICVCLYAYAYMHTHMHIHMHIHIHIILHIVKQTDAIENLFNIIVGLIPFCTPNQDLHEWGIEPGKGGKFKWMGKNLGNANGKSHGE